MSPDDEEYDYYKEFTWMVDDYVRNEKDEMFISAAAKKSKYLANQVIIEMYPDPHEVDAEIFEKYRYLIFQKLLKTIDFTNIPEWNDQES